MRYVLVALALVGCGRGVSERTSNQTTKFSETFQKPACVGQTSYVSVWVQLQGMAPMTGEVRLEGIELTGDQGVGAAAVDDRKETFGLVHGGVSFRVPFTCLKEGTFSIEYDVVVEGESDGFSDHRTVDITCKQCPDSDGCEEELEDFITVLGADYNYEGYDPPPTVAVTSPEGNVVVASDGVQTRYANGDTDVTCASASWVINDLMSKPMPRSSGGNSDTGSGRRAAAPPDTLFLWMKLADSIPDAHSANHYQYGFVLETDDDPANDWVAHPSYPGDFWQGTDTWIEVGYTPSSGWKTTVSKLDGSGQPVATTVDADVYRFGPNIMLTIPASALGDADPLELRFSAFRHQGSWLADDWNADVQPAVELPMARLDR